MARHESSILPITDRLLTRGICRPCAVEDLVHLKCDGSAALYAFRINTPREPAIRSWCRHLNCGRRGDLPANVALAGEQSPRRGGDHEPLMRRARVLILAGLASHESAVLARISAGRRRPLALALRSHSDKRRTAADEVRSHRSPLLRSQCRRCSQGMELRVGMDDTYRSASRSHHYRNRFVSNGVPAEAQTTQDSATRIS